MIWNDEKIVAFDVETSGVLPEYALQPWRCPWDASWLTSCAIIRWQDGRLVPDGSQLFFRFDGTDDHRMSYGEIKPRLRAFLERAIENSWTVVTWFGAFDISWCFAYGLGDLAHKVKWLDGMLLWRHRWIEPEYELDRSKKKSYSLKAAVPEFAPIEHHGYEDNIDFHSTDPIALRNLHRYNNRDGVYTWAFAKVLWDELTERQRECAVTESACLSMIAEANYRGMPVDTLYARELAAKLEKDAADLLEKLSPHGVTEKIVRSPTQLGKLLFDDWGLPVLKENTGKKTGKVSRATDKEVLHELAFVDERCRDLRAYRECLNNRTKFADTPLIAADYNSDGRARPAAIVFGTYSGRLTYASSQGKGVNLKQTGFALHQEKRGKDYRSIIVAPEGYALLEVDASGQEFRWMAELSGDQTMRQLCFDGEDPHSYMGSRIVGMDYRDLVNLVHKEDADAKNNRQLGKVANLSLQYRTYPKTLRKVARVQYNIPMELPEAQRIHRTYQNTYIEVPKYWERQIRLAKKQGYVETLAGRRVQLQGNWDGPLGWQMESTSLNYPVQGTGADQKYLALALLKDYMLGIGGYFAYDLHDGLYWWIPTSKLEKAAADASRILANLPYRDAWGFTPSVPLPWDAKIGPGWGDLKEFKG
jgi:DNA polymerase I-like protein with 3'-5' exonuclease and polymerase domains